MLQLFFIALFFIESTAILSIYNFDQKIIYNYIINSSRCRERKKMSAANRHSREKKEIEKEKELLIENRDHRFKINTR